ncbi:hypothetical protein V6N13_118977 [Hibiscus sabdariffa]|uniref:Carotenoid oxygenase n=1 Tax=Hibiscus sabdariffa TaxID=183260 RepID=A0ABR2DZY7_9ROSI
MLISSRELTLFLLLPSSSSPTVMSPFSQYGDRQPFLRGLQQLDFGFDVLKAAVKNTSVKLLDAFVGSAFEFVDCSSDTDQTNTAPVDELRDAAIVTHIHGHIPTDFPQGVYIRNGPNPRFGGLKSTKSIFGKSSPMWVEGEGMLHALYFSTNIDGACTVTYNNRYVETDTFKLEKLRNKPSFLPAVQGDALAVVSSHLLNLLRFGKPSKNLSNTNVFEHSGKLYSIAENDLPQEIDIFTLEALGDWDVHGAWNRPFTAHPKRAPGTGELVTMGFAPTKPFLQVGVISADGNKLLHKLDLKLDRCPLSHELGVTKRYNVFLDCPITIDVNRLIHGGQLIKYESEGYARIGIMPRYGDADSVQWFTVKPNCTFHIINCFEDDDEVVVWGSRALASAIPGPQPGSKQFEWFPATFKPGKRMEDSISEDQLLFHRPYEWRLNVPSGDVKERFLTGPNHFPMEFPMINEAFTGVKNKYCYTQVCHWDPSSASALPWRAKHWDFFEGGVDEDDGWIITFVHHQDTGISQAYIIDAKNFLNEPVAKITLPCRVPDGFHGAFIPIPRLNKIRLD